MKKQSGVKLSLCRETLRDLDSLTLTAARAVGGRFPRTNVTCLIPCYTERTCTFSWWRACTIAWAPQF